MRTAGTAQSYGSEDGTSLPSPQPWEPGRLQTLDVLACSQRGSRMRLLATIKEPRVVEQILTHLGLPSELVRADPAQPPPPGLFADAPA